MGVSHDGSSQLSLLNSKVLTRIMNSICRWWLPKEPSISGQWNDFSPSHLEAIYFDRYKVCKVSERYDLRCLPWFRNTPSVDFPNSWGPGVPTKPTQQKPRLDTDADGGITASEFEAGKKIVNFNFKQHKSVVVGWFFSGEGFCEKNNFWLGFSFFGRFFVFCWILFIYQLREAPTFQFFLFTPAEN